MLHEFSFYHLALVIHVLSTAAMCGTCGIWCHAEMFNQF